MSFAPRAVASCTKTGPRRRAKCRQRPRLESLEQRELLATVTFPFVPDIPVFGSSITANNGQSYDTGNYLGTLNGTVALSTYSVDINTTDPQMGQNNAAVTTDGQTFGTTIPNASAIAWLLTNLGPKTTSLDAQGALQAAIWRTEYGGTGPNGFQLDGADNDNDPGDNDATLIADYRADLVALGNHTAPVSSVDWISATDPDSGTPTGSFVAIAAGTVEPLSLPSTNPPDFNYTYIDPTSGETNYESAAGGNFLGTLNGTTSLTATYCLSINLGISPPAAYTATVTNNGVIYGSLVPNAGAIAWLVSNVGATAVSADQQDALQAAIWHEEYGIPGFELDGVDNSGTGGDNDPTLDGDYEADLAALGSNTAALGNVYWISPYEAEGGNEDQGLVAVSIPNAPTSISLSATANPAVFGQPLALTATVQNLLGGATPTGSVQFQINGANDGGPVPLTGGAASIANTGLSAGGYAITAVYLPTGSFGSSTTGYGETITAAATSASVSPKTTLVKRKKVMSLVATVVNASGQGGGTPTGTVEFLVDGKDIGSVGLSNGRASVQLSAKLSKGKHKVSVVYTPSTGNFRGISVALQGGKKVTL
jgi:hypothetical protein